MRKITSLRSAGPAILASGLTVIAALLTLSIAEVNSTAGLGPVGAMGVALSATLFTYGLSAAGMSRAQIESPQSWGDAPEIFVHSFNHTVHVVNFFTILSVLFSVVRGPRREIRQR